MRIIVRIIFLYAFLPTLAFAQNKTIAVIGSSTSKGYGLSNPEVECWVNKVKNYYTSKGILKPLNGVINLSESSTNCITGMPTGYVSPYSASGFDKPDPKRNITAAINLIPKPDVILVSYPTNGYDWLPFNEIIKDLSVIKKTAEEAGIRCFIVSTQPRNNFSPSERLKLKQLKDTIMARFGDDAIDFFTPIASPDNTIAAAYNYDNVHPNAAGHEQLFKKVIEKDLFKTTIPPPPPVPATLPFAFSKFEINRKLDSVTVIWEVKNEPNHSYYRVERSHDSIHFNLITRMQGQAGSKPVYSFTESLPEEDYYIYRITAFDSSDKEIENRIGSILKLKKALVIKGIFPLPAHNQIYIHILSEKNSTINITLLDFYGKQQKQNLFALNKGNNTLNYPLMSFNSGIYFLRVENDLQVETLKFLKAN
jgi:lysophospholipase L1-like esterase